MALSKEQMFDFILENYVDISPDGTWYGKYDDEGELLYRFQNKYRISINGSGMCGFDLEEAINYYVENLQDKEQEAWYAGN